MALLRWARPAALGILATCVVAGPGPASAQPPATEDAVKAVFLYNFAKYVAWPAPAGTNGTPAPLRLCIPAHHVLFELVQATVAGETIDGRPLRARVPDGLDDARDCDILFVGDTSTSDARAWLMAARGTPVLTVGEGGLRGDVVVAFVRDSNRVRFDINRAAAGRQGLTVSAKLLRLARRVLER